MKKSLLIITVLLVIVSVFVFTGCSSNNPLKKMGAIWNEKEVAAYNVYAADPDSEGNEGIKSIGIMNLTIKTITDSTAVIIGKDTLKAEFPAETCYYSEMILSITDTGESVVSMALFDRNFTPIASYRKTVLINEETKKLDTFEYLMSYSTGKKSKASYSYVKLSGTKEVDRGENEIALKGNCFDNEAIYVAARASRPEVGESVSFVAVSVEANKTETIGLSSSGSTTLNLGEKELDCYKVNISVSNDYTPGNFYCYIAKEPMTFRGATVDKPIIKIQEGKYFYKLIEFTEVKES